MLLFGVKIILLLLKIVSIQVIRYRVFVCCKLDLIKIFIIQISPSPHRPQERLGEAASWGICVVGQGGGGPLTEPVCGVHLCVRRKQPELRDLPGRASRQTAQEPGRVAQGGHGGLGSLVQEAGVETRGVEEPADCWQSG